MKKRYNEYMKIYILRIQIVFAGERNVCFAKDTCVTYFGHIMSSRNDCNLPDEVLVNNGKKFCLLKNIHAISTQNRFSVLRRDSRSIYKSWRL